LLTKFGTAGIRGLTFEEISPELAEKVARTYGHHLRQQGKTTVVVGRDTRHGAHALELAAAAGFSAAGISVIRCGVLPTPALATYMTAHHADGGMIITGSHTPPERIGLIVMFQDGSYLYGEAAREIEKWIPRQPSTELYAPYNKAGRITRELNALEEYRSYLLGRTKVDLLRSKKWKVLVDPANGTGSGIAASVFHAVGADVLAINDTPDGIPNRPSEPRENTLDEAREVVQATHADLGLCFDIDADRVVFVAPSAEGDEKAIVIPPDIIGVTLMEAVLQQTKGPVVLPINSSGLADHVLKEMFGEKVIHCRIGQPATIAACKENAAVFSYEESGKYYFIGEGVLWTDGILAALRLLEFLTSKELVPFDLLARYPPFYTRTINTEVPVRQRTQVFEQALIKWEDEPVAGSRVIHQTRIDGCRKTYEDGAWLLIRPSGTEPLVRVVADSRHESRALELVEYGARLVSSSLEEVSSRPEAS